MAISSVRNVRMLYKSILKLHRGLPPDLKSLGDLYAREEFKRHKHCNESEATVFMCEWTDYALNLAKQLGLRGAKDPGNFGKNLDAPLLDKMREDQILQLYELLQAASEKETNS